MRNHSLPLKKEVFFILSMVFFKFPNTYIVDVVPERDYNASRGYGQNAFRGGAPRGIPTQSYVRRGGYNSGAAPYAPAPGGNRPPQRWEGEYENGGGWIGGPAPPQQWTEAPPPIIQNERWQEPPPAGQWMANDRWKEPQRRPAAPFVDGRGGGYAGNARWKEGGGDSDWTTPLPKDERLELEMFGTGNSGINFDKYEDIPVEATGNDPPSHISTVSSFFRFLPFLILV